MTTPKNVMKLIKDSDVKYVDFRFTDPRGKWQHVTFDVSLIEEETFAEGQMFDGSSIAGWKAIHEFDMCLMPDPSTACIDPFFAETTLVLVCATCSSPRPASPIRATRAASPKKPKAWSSPWALATRSISDPRRNSSCSTTSATRLSRTTPASGSNSVEFPSNSDTEFEGGNLGHRVWTKKGYFPVPPQDLGAGHAFGNARRNGAHGRQG